MKLRARRLATVSAVVVGLSAGHPTLAHGGGSERQGPPPHAGHERGPRPAADRAPETYSFSLSGSQVPGGGDPDGRARAVLGLDPGHDVVCLRTQWRDLAGDVTAIHVHRAPPGQTGPHHIDLLDDERLAGHRNQVEFCVKVGGSHHQAKSAESGGTSNPVQEVIDHPEDFYLNIHSTAHPAGAIRGQIAG